MVAVVQSFEPLMAGVAVMVAAHLVSDGLMGNVAVSIHGVVVVPLIVDKAAKMDRVCNALFRGLWWW